MDLSLLSGALVLERGCAPRRALIVVAALALATLTYFTIERPMLRLKSRLPA